MAIATAPGRGAVGIVRVSGRGLAPLARRLTGRDLAPRVATYGPFLDAEGRPIAEPLEESGVFPNMVIQMINVGESVGALDSMLEKIADFYDEEVDQAVENLTAMIEPFMMVFLGGMIGGLVVAMYLPIFKIASVV